MPVLPPTRRQSWQEWVKAESSLAGRTMAAKPAGMKRKGIIYERHEGN